jgi:uncharacterized protein (DUF58 family)
VAVLPFALVIAAVPEATLLAGIVVGTLVALILADAALSRTALRGLGVALPPVVRLFRNRPGMIEVRLRNELSSARRLRLGLALPPDIQSRDNDLWAMVPGAGGWHKLEWPCTPTRRGNYRLDDCQVEAVSRLGFWAVRANRPLDCEVRVYPDLLTERKGVAALFLNRGSHGAHAQRQVGKGRDFEKLREYVHGDGFDEVHWKATAKRGRPVTKVFQIERTQEVYVIVDASRLSGRGQGVKKSVVGGPLSVAKVDREPEATTDHGQLTTDNALSETTVLERFVTAALLLGLAAERQGDHFGLLTFSDRVLKFVRARNGKSHYSTCRDAIYGLQPEDVTPDFDELCSFIRLRLRRRALLVFLTSLDDPVLAESFVRNMDLICRQHLILVNMIHPPDAGPIFSDPNVTTLDDVYLKLGGHVLWHKLSELGRVLQRRGVRFSLLQDERLSTELVTQYLTIKRRQLI